jgi:hypothetical protein
MMTTRVADGPITGTGWYVLHDPPSALIAPGGVVLCQDTTKAPHDEAEAAARRAWWELVQRLQPPPPGSEPAA